jgi:hypothetical protein
MAGKDKRGDAEFIPKRVTAGLPAEILERRYLPDPVEYVLGERVEKQRLEMWFPYLPPDRMNVGEKSHAQVSFEGEERREVAIDPEFILVAGAIENAPRSRCRTGRMISSRPISMRSGRSFNSGLR